MNLEQFTDAISTLGFPIVVTLIVLYQSQQTMTRLSVSMEHLSESIRGFQKSFFEKIGDEVRMAASDAVSREMAKWLHGVETTRISRTDQTSSERKD